MSNYKDFVQDFPTRCRDVVMAFSKEAQRQDREVTLLLMATTAGFVMPYERLREGEAIKQPPLDRPHFSEAAEQLKQELGKRIAESTLFQDAEWRGGPLRSAVGTPDEWPECRNPRRLPPETLVSDVVRYLRHGLAHGNVFTRADRSNHISELIFVCGGTLRNGKEMPLKFLLLSPRELRFFLDRWFKFVGDLRLPHWAVLEVIDHAA
ncbi:MAG: hypothetical protein ACE5FE_11345 [Acidiferrobacterales bacterium]